MYRDWVSSEKPERGRWLSFTASLPSLPGPSDPSYSQNTFLSAVSFLPYAEPSPFISQEIVSSTSMAGAVTGRNKAAISTEMVSPDPAWTQWRKTSTKSQQRGKCK